jgi:phosphoserine aminotransferase
MITEVVDPFGGKIAHPVSLPGVAQSAVVTNLRIPVDLLPGDGRFGSGPAKIRPQSVQHLAASGNTLLGTSHRQAPVKDLVGAVRSGLSKFVRSAGGP